MTKARLLSVCILKSACISFLVCSLQLDVLKSPSSCLSSTRRTKRRNIFYPEIYEVDLWQVYLQPAFCTRSAVCILYWLIILYVHKESNHPPSILNPFTKGYLKCHQIENASIMLKASIEKHATKVATALSFTPSQALRPQNTRQRNILWLNPPYNKSVVTNSGKCFLSLINKHFPKSNPFHSFSTITHLI